MLGEAAADVKNGSKRSSKQTALITGLNFILSKIETAFQSVISNAE